jgi:DNA (cytosine-5)-methyltransferase 1
VKAGKLRRLTPEELEQGNMFAAGHTRFCMLDGEVTEVDPKHRAFFMGNALVVGIVENIGSALIGAKPSCSKKKMAPLMFKKAE